MWLVKAKYLYGLKDITTMENKYGVKSKDLINTKESAIKDHFVITSQNLLMFYFPELLTCYLSPQS